MPFNCVVCLFVCLCIYVCMCVCVWVCGFVRVCVKRWYENTYIIFNRSLIWNKPFDHTTIYLILTTEFLHGAIPIKTSIRQITFTANECTIIIITHFGRALNNIIPPNQSFHSYPTRRSNEFRLPLLRTIFLAQNIFIYYTGPLFWNSLDVDK